MFAHSVPGYPYTLATSFSLALHSFTIRCETLAGGAPNDSAAVNRQLVATRVMVVNPADPAGPSVVMADDTPPSFTPGYPKLTALNCSALLLEVSLDEPGAVVFALRPGTAAAPELNRSAVEAAAGWSASHYPQQSAAVSAYVTGAAAAAAGGGGA